MPDKPCPNCGGSGYVEEYDERGFKIVYKCSVCGGSGAVPDDEPPSEEEDKTHNLHQPKLNNTQ